MLGRASLCFLFVLQETDNCGSCRPSIGQRAFYNGKDRIHGLKFQGPLTFSEDWLISLSYLYSGVSTPDGLIAHMTAPYFGARHDAFLYSNSGLRERIEALTDPHDNSYALFGDVAYTLQPTLFRPFKTVHPTPAQELFNNRMKPLRVTVEWTFGKITRLFPTLSWHRNQRILESPVGPIYQVAALLTNAHTCLYGSSTGEYFNFSPPSLEDYFNSLHNNVQ